MRAQGPLGDVELAVVGRVLEEYQVCVRVRLEPVGDSHDKGNVARCHREARVSPGEPGQQHPPPSPLLLLDLVCVVKLLLQQLTDLRRESKDIIYIHIYMCRHIHIIMYERRYHWAGSNGGSICLRGSKVK